jgi:hypothetical protein
MQKPEVVERLNIDGSHRYWDLVDPETGGVLWREFTVMGDDSFIYGRSMADRGMNITLDGALRAHAFEPTKGIMIIGSKPSPAISEIVYMQKKLMSDIFAVPFVPYNTPIAREHLSVLEEFGCPPDSEESPHIKEYRKSYGEPPWKFNKPFNHKAQNYVKSNNRNRTARKR